MPIFRVKSVKIYTGQKKFTRICSWGSWQISGMMPTSHEGENHGNCSKTMSSSPSKSRPGRGVVFRQDKPRPLCLEMVVVVAGKPALLLFLLLPLLLLLLHQQAEHQASSRSNPQNYKLCPTLVCKKRLLGAQLYRHILEREFEAGHRKRKFLHFLSNLGANAFGNVFFASWLRSSSQCPIWKLKSLRSIMC